MSALAIILIIFIALYLLREPISRWLSGFMARRAEDTMRRMMGMPSRKEERRKAKRQSAGDGFSRTRTGSAGNARRRHRPPTADAATILKSVAEDVEFTEIREFESTTIADERKGEQRIYREEQVTDAEFIEIKDKV